MKRFTAWKAPALVLLLAVALWVGLVNAMPTPSTSPALSAPLSTGTTDAAPLPLSAPTALANRTEPILFPVVASRFRLPTPTPTATPSPAVVWTFAEVERALQVGYWNISLQEDATGKLHVCYPIFQQTVRYGTWDGGHWGIETVGWGMISQPAMVLDRAGRPHLAFYTIEGLVYAQRVGDAWQFELVAAESDWFYRHGVSIAVDVDGSPHVVFRRRGEEGVAHAYKSAGQWHIEQVGGGEIYQPVVVVDSVGRIYILHGQPIPTLVGDRLYALMFSAWSGHAWTTVPLDMALAGWTLALDRQDAVHIVYSAAFEHPLWHAWWTDNVLVREPIALQPGHSGPALTFDAGNVAHVSFGMGFRGGEDGLRYAWRAADGWRVEVVALGDLTGYVSDIVVGRDGVVNIVYNDATREPETLLMHARGAATH